MRLNPLDYMGLEVAEARYVLPDVLVFTDSWIGPPGSPFERRHGRDYFRKTAKAGAGAPIDGGNPLAPSRKQLFSAHLPQGAKP